MTHGCCDILGAEVQTNIKSSVLKVRGQPELEILQPDNGIDWTVGVSGVSTFSATTSNHSQSTKKTPGEHKLSHDVIKPSGIIFVCISKLTCRNNFLKKEGKKTTLSHLKASIIFPPFLLGTLITQDSIYQRLLRNSCTLPIFMYVCSCPPSSALGLPVLPFSITSVYSAVQVPWSLFCTLWSLHSQVLPQVLGPLQGSVEGTLFSLRRSFSAHCDLCAFF